MRATADAAVVVTSIAFAVWTFCTFLVRIYMRTKVNGPWMRDDWTAALATGCGLFQAALVIVSIWLGPTEQSSSSELHVATQTTLAAKILYAIGLGLSRISTSFMLSRLERSKKKSIAIYASAVLSAIWMIAAAIALGVTQDESCPDGFHLWLGIEVSGIMIELLILSLVFALIWNLKMRYKKKALVVYAFAARLIVIAPIGWRLYAIRKAPCLSVIVKSDATVAIATTIALHLSIMAATFTCMKQFLGAFDFGGFDEFTPRTQLPGDEYQLSTSNHSMNRSGTALSTGGKGKSVSKVKISAPLEAMRPAMVRSESRAHKGQKDETGSLGSDSSEQNIIKKTQRWDVTYD